ncbi:uncharacterized protein LOC126398968 [Epinephelus moara]|uniref:uncharacterized protein LOC126398968 n=1 Tax=Epinephelus moara TaxID=300413 RepID=UPI00214E190E|nr:uncharacterized protein LOC126398968 [Epinephelus moara]XP_049914606.1 uncharacterized protein LOC126398968 [Epinephelus moara]
MMCQRRSLTHNHRHVAEQFGVDTLKLVREYERMARKIADYRNHLRFNLRCRQNRLIPTSLRLCSTMKGYKVDKIMEKAQNQLLNERVRQTHFTIEGLKEKADHLLQKLTSLLPEVVLGKIIDLTKKAQLSQHTKSKERQKRKSHNLQIRSNTNKTEILTWRQKTHTNPTQDEMQDRWIKNLSDREFTHPERGVLTKGLNFAMTSQQLPIVDLITATESAMRKNNLTGTEAEQLRLKVSAALSNAMPPPSNLTTEERKVVTSLSKDPNITILPADKGRCTVVLNTSDYHNKVATLLSDTNTNTNEPLKRDPTSGYKKKTIEILQKLQKEGTIDRLQYHRLYPQDAIPCIYGLPKIHKEGAPLRPIVSSINSVTYNIAKHLANILAPLVGNTPHHIQNSIDFVNKVRGLKMDPDDTMVSYDVTSLFTCIPTMEAVETVWQRLIHDNTLHDRTKLSPDQLLDLCLSTTYFKYNGNFYRQKHGCAMGSPVSPIVANLYMEDVEYRALNSFKGTTPSHWFRYVDDTWVKIKTQEMQAFTQHIDSVDRNIKFTREDVKDNGLPFLDCDVHITEDKGLHIGVYRKPTHTDQYLLFDSHHPLEHKLGVIRTLQHRADNLPTSTQAQGKEHEHLREALKTCGYPSWTFVKTAARNRKNKVGDEEKSKRNNIVIPYVSGVSEKLGRIFNKHRIPVYFKPSNTLRQRLVHPKDRTPHTQKSNLVYAVQCSEECPDLYIGETKQPLNKRTAQHRRANSSGQDSVVYLHLKEKVHSFEDSNVHTLDREDRWFERGVKEAIYVKLEKPSLNRGGGLRHHLSPTYNAVLSSLPRRCNSLTSNDCNDHRCSRNFNDRC